MKEETLVAQRTVFDAVEKVSSFIVTTDMLQVSQRRY
jgi:hypothetical protein